MDRKMNWSGWQTFGLLVIVVAMAISGFAGPQKDKTERFDGYMFSKLHSAEQEDKELVRTTELSGMIKEALQSIECYHLRMNIDDESEFFFDGDIDVVGKAMHFTVTIGGESRRETEVYWIGEKAYGLPRHLEEWFQVAVPGEPVSYLHAIAGILETGKITARREAEFADEACWVLSIIPDLSQLQGNAKDFTRALFPQLHEGSEEEIQISATIEQAIKEMEMQTEFWISKKTHYILKAIIEAYVFGTRHQTIYHVSDVNNPELHIFAPPEALQAEGPPLPLGTLLMKFDAWESHSSYWGWWENTHCLMTEEALKLIRKNDPKEKYREIYYGYPDQWGTVDKPPYYKPQNTTDFEPGLKDHPCVVGAWSEDAWDKPRTRGLLDPSAMTVTTYRPFRHFGYTWLGLKYQWYFKLIGSSIPKPPSGYYLSARDWGLHGGNSGDKINFRGAIDVYNNYTYDGIKEAYRRLGHVLHLFQDLAQPDHAGLKDHAASGYTEPDAYKTFNVCNIVMAEAAVIAAPICAKASSVCTIGYWACLAACIGTAAGSAYGACQASIDNDEVGFEWLIKEKWNFDRKDVSGKTVTDKLVIEKEGSTPYQADVYYNYFSNMAKYSLNAAKSKNLALPLGLGKIPFFPFNLVPGLDPDIKYPGGEKPFLELADDVIIKATNKCAGFLQYFFEAVNHPPYIQEVVVYQGSVQMVIDKVTGEIFPANPDKKPSPNIIYRGWWECKYDDPSKLTKKIKYRELHCISKPFDSSLWTYIITRITSNMEELTLTLKDVAGTKVKEARMTKVAPTFTKKYASHCSWLPYPCCEYPPTAYYGAIIGPNSIQCCGLITFEFAGKDLEPHFSYHALGRKHSGKELDSNPTTIAAVENVFPHNWKYDPTSQLAYEPGPDSNHKIWIFSPDAYESNDNIANATSIKVDVGENKKFNNLSLHNNSDKDFFSLKVPIDPKCKGATSPYVFYPYNIIPSVLQICAKPEFPLDSLIITIFVNGTSKQHTFTVGKDCPASPLVVGSVAFIGVEDWFPGGIVNFMVEAKPDKSGKKEPGCYSMTIKHGKCSIEKPVPSKP